MTKIRQLLEDKNQKIDHSFIDANYKWIFENNLNCIISPDSDGLMSALLMSNYLNWKIKGFYDGKVLVYEKNTKLSECVFLDMEIAIKNIRSLGQHMITPHNKTYELFGNDIYQNCLSPNKLRNYDANKSFRLKFPMASVHFLISLLYNKIEIKLDKSSIFPLLFVDGMYKVMFSYPENVLNWFSFLRIDEEKNPLNNIFYSTGNSLMKIMDGMNNFFHKRDEFKGNEKRDRGDRLILSDENGAKNLNKISELYEINKDNKERIINFTKFISEMLGWSFKEENWTFDNFRLVNFEKKKLESATGVTKDKRFTIENFKKIYEEKPLSMAVTAGNRLEYTMIGNNEDLFY